MDAKPQAKYTEKDLKKKFSSFKEAKTHFGISARGWQTLVDKLNEPSLKDLKLQVQKLTAEIEALKSENEQLKTAAVKGDGFDEVGFWLLDRNFERSKFEDFEIDEEATEIESKAKAEYRRLAQKYHPDNGGTDEQMANVKRLHEQMLAIVEINGGVGL